MATAEFIAQSSSYFTPQRQLSVAMLKRIAENTRWVRDRCASPASCVYLTDQVVPRQPRHYAAQWAARGPFWYYASPFTNRVRLMLTCDIEVEPVNVVGFSANVTDAQRSFSITEAGLERALAAGVSGVQAPVGGGIPNPQLVNLHDVVVQPGRWNAIYLAIRSELGATNKTFATGQVTPDKDLVFFNNSTMAVPGYVPERWVALSNDVDASGPEGRPAFTAAHAHFTPIASWPDAGPEGSSATRVVVAEMSQGEAASGRRINGVDPNLPAVGWEGPLGVMKMYGLFVDANAYPYDIDNPPDNRYPQVRSEQRAGSGVANLLRAVADTHHHRMPHYVIDKRVVDIRADYPGSWLIRRLSGTDPTSNIGLQRRYVGGFVMITSKLMAAHEKDGLEILVSCGLTANFDPEEIYDVDFEIVAKHMDTGVETTLTTETRTIPFVGNSLTSNSRMLNWMQWASTYNGALSSPSYGIAANVGTPFGMDGMASIEDVRKGGIMQPLKLQADVSSLPQLEPHIIRVYAKYNGSPTSEAKSITFVVNGFGARMLAI